MIGQMVAAMCEQLATDGGMANRIANCALYMAVELYKINAPAGVLMQGLQQWLVPIIMQTPDFESGQQLIDGVITQVKEQLEAAGLDTSRKGGAKPEEKEKETEKAKGGEEKKAEGETPEGKSEDKHEEPTPAAPEPTADQIEMVTGLGFPQEVAVFALKKFGSAENGPAYYDVQRSVDYLFSNGP